MSVKMDDFAMKRSIILEFYSACYFISNKKKYVQFYDFFNGIFIIAIAENYFCYRSNNATILLDTKRQ